MKKYPIFLKIAISDISVSKYRSILIFSRACLIQISCSIVTEVCNIGPSSSFTLLLSNLLEQCYAILFQFLITLSSFATRTASYNIVDPDRIHDFFRFDFKYQGIGVPWKVITKSRRRVYIAFSIFVPCWPNW